MSEVHGLFSSAVSFQKILDEIPMGAMLLDSDRRIVAVNRALEAMTGFVRGDACGIRCANILRNAVCIENCPVEKGHFDLESEPCCLDGNIINRDRQKVPVRITVAPVTDVQGACCGYLETVENLQQVEGWAWKAENAYRFGHLIGNSPQMSKIFQAMPMIGLTDSTVLITGETGTGKDIIAEAIHLASDRSKGPFIKVNCGALPETLLESELFGHQKGAFTGAGENKPGRFKLAHNGTLFLTEIGDLPLGLQTKLLMFLDDKTVFPLGSTQGIKVNVRVIAATLRDLETMVQVGQFRSDLLFRLNVIRIHLPPLRDRTGDVLLLLDQLLRTLSEHAHKKITGYSPEALELLLEYSYPGNVRELKNIVEYAVTFCGAGKVQLAHLPDYLRLEHARGIGNTSSPLQEFTPAKQAENPERVLPHIVSEVPLSSGTTWKDMEKQMILDALKQAKGKRSQAADALGWGRSTLWRKMKALGLDT
ncbi:PAS domain S-box-containing protein [Desulfonatronum thiosulfatophilum]|uniref:PAS domain S-box-containing protein n=1 Tax=Desulfonatronum thiosulfatophilum TaxID=617002 RepID=A0A1G6D6C5_9BACT|nr:sigma 54-interacting transcriptional regulator [Desulfonatronum thiosulfatophilum]SDB40707.1 PAS domain S-box-containing protein [Desulfonatronum thiosulfatophilum]